MNERLEALAGFVLAGLIKGNLSDASAQEFAEEVCSCIQKEGEICRGYQMEKLWDYLAGGSAALDKDKQDSNSVFQQGRIYATMELLKIFCQQQEEEFILEEDARAYGDHWRGVFWALRNGKSMTHRELAGEAGLSDSSLSQFMHKIAEKNYILFRKVGRTKYYRLSNRGKKLLQYIIPLRKKNSFSLEGFMDKKLDPRSFHIGTFIQADNYLGIQKKIDFKGSYPLINMDSINYKANMEAKVIENVYV